MPNQFLALETVVGGNLNWSKDYWRKGVLAGHR